MVGTIINLIILVPLVAWGIYEISKMKPNNKSTKHPHIQTR